MPPLTFSLISERLSQLSPFLYAPHLVDVQKLTTTIDKHDAEQDACEVSSMIEHAPSHEEADEVQTDDSKEQLRSARVVSYSGQNQSVTKGV